MDNAISPSLSRPWFRSPWCCNTDQALCTVGFPRNCQLRCSSSSMSLAVAMLSNPETSRWTGNRDNARLGFSTKYRLRDKCPFASFSHAVRLLLPTPVLSNPFWVSCLSSIPPPISYFRSTLVDISTCVSSSSRSSSHRSSSPPLEFPRRHEDDFVSRQSMHMAGRKTKRHAPAAISEHGLTTVP